MIIKAIIKIFLILQAVLLVTSCVSGSGNPASSAAVSRTIPTGVGGADCQTKMNAARNWVVNNTGFALTVNSENQIATDSSASGFEELEWLDSEDAALAFNRAVSSAF